MFNFVFKFMVNKQIIRNSRNQKLRLPFEKRPTDIGSWSYDHRFGLCITVIAILLFGIIFMSAKIRVNSVKIVGFVLNVTETPVIIAEPVIEKRVQKKLTKQDFADIKNALSSEQAEEMDKTQSKSESEFAESIMNEAKDVAKGTNSNRARYEQGLREEQAIIDSMRNGAKKEKRVDVKVKGNVTVSFSFVNPVRKSVQYDVPAYMCEGGGRVVINATVNKNGYVVSATVDKNRSISDECIVSTALNAAKKFKFNVDGLAPDRHTGTISYIFVPQ